MINKDIDLASLAKDRHINYINRNRYPNIVIDNFFDENLLKSLFDEFDSNRNNKVTFNNPNEKKLTFNSWSDFGPKTIKFIKFLNSKSFTDFLENLTGIKSLLSDDLLEDAGLQQVSSGGYLKIHADFNKHSKLNFDRRLNALVYLNEKWAKEWGGEFETWSKDLKKCVQKISLIFNWVVIFSTTSQSFHGHLSLLKTPKNIYRKSIAMYYYTNGRPKGEIQDGLKFHSTLFKERINKLEDKKCSFIIS